MLRKEKWKKKNNEKNRTNQSGKTESSEKRKITSLWEYWKQTHQIPGDERQNKKRLLQTNEKDSQSQSLLQTSHKMDKDVSSPLWKILWTILKMDKGKTQINRPNDKKLDEDI